jgi:hypothetical protein
MFDLDGQEVSVFLSAGFYIFLLGGVLFLGYRAARGGIRGEEDKHSRDQAALVERVRQQVRADLEVARRAQGAAASPPAEPPSTRRAKQVQHATR